MKFANITILFTSGDRTVNTKKVGYLKVSLDLVVTLKNPKIYKFLANISKDVDATSY